MPKSPVTKNSHFIYQFKRSLAFALDFFILGIIHTALDNIFSSIDSYVFYLLSATIFFSYFFLLEYIYSDSTLGKKLFKFKVKYSTQSPLQSALVRHSVITLWGSELISGILNINGFASSNSLSTGYESFFIFYASFNLFKGLYDKSGTLIHDMLSSSQVSPTSEDGHSTVDLRKIILPGVLSALCVFGINQWQKRLDVITQEDLSLSEKIRLSNKISDSFKKVTGLRNTVAIGSTKSLKSGYIMRSITITAPAISVSKLSDNSVIVEALTQLKDEEKIYFISKDFSLITVMSQGFFRLKKDNRLFPHIIEAMKKEYFNTEKFSETKDMMLGKWTGQSINPENEKYKWTVNRKDDLSFDILFQKELKNGKIEESTEKGQWICLGNYYITLTKEIDGNSKGDQIYDVYKILSLTETSFKYKSLNNGQEFTLTKTEGMN